MASTADSVEYSPVRRITLIVGFTLTILSRTSKPLRVGIISSSRTISVRTPKAKSNPSSGLAEVTDSIDSVYSNWILLACEFDGGDSLLGERKILASKKNRPLVGRFNLIGIGELQGSTNQNHYVYSGIDTITKSNKKE